MGKLHEILAVEADREGLFRSLLAETAVVFSKKQNIFQGAIRELKFNEGEDGLDTTEHLKIETTVGDKLEYLSKAVINYLDVVLQKDKANQAAVADIEIDGEVIATGLPAVNLLGLEAKLKKIREVYMSIPTLQVGVAWEKDENLGKGVFRNKHAEIKAKTAKRIRSAVLYEATKEHPAQIDKWNEDVPVGKITTQNFSGMLSSKAKSEILGRLDKLIQSVKQARMRANMVEVQDARIGAELVSFIHGGSLD